MHPSPLPDSPAASSEHRRSNREGLRRDSSARASHWSSDDNCCPNNELCEEGMSAALDRALPFPCTFHYCTCRIPRDRRATADTGPPPPRSSRRCSCRDAFWDTAAEERTSRRSPHSLPWDSGTEQRWDREEGRDRGQRRLRSGFPDRGRGEKRDRREGVGRTNSRPHILHGDRGSS